MKRRTSTDAEATEASKPQGGVVELEFIGSLQRITGRSPIDLRVEGEITLLQLVTALGRRYGAAFFTQLAGQSDAARGLTSLVLVNGREVSALDGIHTLVKPGDKVVFIPVAHGG